MALVEISFDIDGDAQYVRAFELLAHEARDLREPLEEIAESLIQAVGRQFLTEGAAGGSRWRPLNPAYARWKDAHFPGRPLLVATGRMRAAALDKRRAVSVGAHRMVYEIHDPKAAYHQRGQGANPQRKLVELDLGVRRSWDRIVAEWVDGLRRGPLRHSAAGR